MHSINEFKNSSIANTNKRGAAALILLTVVVVVLSFVQLTNII